MSNVSSFRNLKHNLCVNVDTKRQGSNVDIPFLFPDQDTVEMQVPIQVLRPNKDNDEVANLVPNPEQFQAVQGEQEQGKLPFA